MGTHNFTRVNASKVYAIDLKYDRENFKDDFIYKVAHTFHVSSKKCKPSADPNNLYFSNCNYPSENISSILIFPSVFHQDIPVCIHFYLTSGYYEGANLDYDIEFFPYKKLALSEYKSLEDMRDDILDFEFNNNDDKEQFKKRFIPIMNKIKRIAENICEQMSDSELECIGTFSNGEAVYKNIN